MQHRPPPRQLTLGFLAQRVPGAADWERLDPARRARAVAILARMIRRASEARERRGARDD